MIASGLRATVGKALMDAWEPGTEMIGETTDDAWNDQLRLVERWHGSAEGRLRIAASPRGPRNATPELWRRCVELAEERDLVLHTHVAENQRQADLLGARPEGRDVVALAAWGALSPRMVMAHSIWLDDDRAGAGAPSPARTSVTARRPTSSSRRASPRCPATSATASTSPSAPTGRRATTASTRSPRCGSPR